MEEKICGYDKKLKPCPFCGGKAHFAPWSNRIYCEECNMSVIFEHEYMRGRIADAYNKRIEYNKE